MNFFEGVLVFLGIPLLVVIGVYLLFVVPGRSKARPAYRPGDPWDFSARFYTGDTSVDVPQYLTDSPLGGARGTW